ncbi:MAG: Uma2 family endonuclease [Bryobacteraceae bacterium]|jgi:Uma2 family endonuclease
MSAAPNWVPVEEYLHNTYHPDCDYVDGVLVERNVGEIRHARAQRAALFYLFEKRILWGIFALQETRVQVSSTRYRVPDVCVGLGPEPEDGILTDPPFICIEVLSPEDRISRMREKIDDYLRFGVRYVWIIDPYQRRAWIYTANETREVRDGLLRTENPELNVPLADVVGPPPR